MRRHCSQSQTSFEVSTHAQDITHSNLSDFRNAILLLPFNGHSTSAFAIKLLVRQNG